MHLVDLTLPIPDVENGAPTTELEQWPICMGSVAYIGMVYRFSHWSMSGTYIDFPGHIKEADDGIDAANCPIESIFDVDTVVLHLERDGMPGKISREELERACSVAEPTCGLIVHALGSKRFDEVPERSLALSPDAVAWIIERGTRILVSDVYEHYDEPEDVFVDLFSAGVSTVCNPINLHALREPRVRLTVLFPRFSGVTQLPCRAVARIG